MPVRPNDPSAVLLEHDVVQEAKKGLEEEQDEEDDSDDRVGIMKCCSVRGARRHVDANREGGDVEDVGEDLEEAVDPPETWERSESDHDAANGEEEGEGERGEDGVRDDHGVVAIRDELGEIASEAIAAIAVPAVPIIAAIIVGIASTVATKVPAAELGVGESRC